MLVERVAGRPEHVHICVVDSQPRAAPTPRPPPPYAQPDCRRVPTLKVTFITDVLTLPYGRHPIDSHSFSFFCGCTLWRRPHVPRPYYLDGQRLPHGATPPAAITAPAGTGATPKQPVACDHCNAAMAGVYLLPHAPPLPLTFHHRPLIITPPLTAAAHTLCYPTEEEHTTPPNYMPLNLPHLNL